MRTRLIIYAPATLRRAAWQALLSAPPAIETVGAVADLVDIPPYLAAAHPITLLVDVPAPHPELARRCRVFSPSLGILILVAAYTLDGVLPLIQAGATGCLSYDESVGDLSRAIIAVGRGEMVVPPALATELLTDLARGARGGESAVEDLSEREGEVLNLLARGYTNKDIAQTLVLSVRTVEAHLRTIYGKIGLRSRTEAALWAIRHGYGQR